MKPYDFYNSFSPLEFQNFARDMIQIREDIFIESFAEGKDMGIDGRHVRADGYTIIMQAKRLLNTSERILSVAQKEKAKLDNLVKQGMRVDRYILALSGDLTVEKKEVVRKIFSPYILAFEDIVTGGDFNNYLSTDREKYWPVEEKYYKLWIQNTAALKRSIYEAVHTPMVHQSEIYLNEAIEKANLFVETDIYEEAIKKVQKNKVLIISGEPGVGKTTLANQVALYYYAKYQFQAYIYASSVEDLYTAQGIDGRKVIIFDDFWGSNGFDAFGNGMHTKELVTFIEYIQKRKDCLLILTTREYVLEQGLKKNEDFRRKVESNKLECRLDQYSEADKLKIYYGHLKNTVLTWDQVNALKGAERRIINSKNYNPRVIEMFTKSVTPDIEPQCCVENFIQYLECPVDFWKKIFTELSQEAKVVYLLMAIMPLPLEIKILEESYCNVLKANQKSLEWKGFSEIIIELEKTVVRTDMYSLNYSERIVVTFQNPSAKDFIMELFRENFEIYRDILQQGCIYFSQCVEYLKLLDDIPGSDDLYETMLEKAISLLESKSIIFYSRYIRRLATREDRYKYYQRYYTKQDCSELGYGRYFQLLLLYKSINCFKLKGWFEKIFTTIIRSIERYPESVLKEDLQVFPEIAVKLEQEGICDNIEWMMDVYVNSLMKNREELDGKEFAEAYEKLWNEYIYSNREKIDRYLNRYYRAEFCLAAAENNVDEFVYLDERCHEIFQKLGLEISDDLHKEIGHYDSWIDADYEDSDLDEESISGLRENIEEIKRDFKESFLDVILPTEVEDMEAWLEINAVPENIQSVMKAALYKHADFWDFFIHDEESLEFLTLLVSYTGHLPESILEASRDIVRYMAEKCGGNKEALFQIINSFRPYERRLGILSSVELEAKCPDIGLGGDDIIDKMLESHILVRRHHWYRLSNRMILFSVYIDHIGQLSDAERNVYYANVFQKAEDEEQKAVYCLEDYTIQSLIATGRSWQRAKDTMRLSELALYELDQELFKRYELIPLACESYSNLYADTIDEVIHNLIDEMDMEFDVLEDGTQTGWTLYQNDFFFALECISSFSLFDAIPDKFTEEQIKILRDNDRLKSGEEVVSLKQLEEMDLLKYMGIYEPLELIWNEICRWKLEGENNGWC